MIIKSSFRSVPNIFTPSKIQKPFYGCSFTIFFLCGVFGILLTRILIMYKPVYRFSHTFRIEITDYSVFPVYDLFPVAAAIGNYDRLTQNLCFLHSETLSFKSCTMHKNISLFNECIRVFF